MTTQHPTREELNAVVKQLAARDRPKVVEILARYGALNTPGVKQEDIAAARAAVLEALKQLEAGAP